jgi:hypothetical protein
MANPLYNTPPAHRLSVSSLLSPPEMKRSGSFGSSIAPSFDQSPSSSQPFSSVSSKPSMSQPTMSFHAPTHANPDAYASPPISPYEPHAQQDNINMDCMSDRGSRDPQLFGGDASHSIAPDVPLFPQESTQPHPHPQSQPPQPQLQPPSQDVISEHMESSRYARLQSKPVRADYELVVSFQSTVFAQAMKNPRRWWEQERRLDRYYGKPSRVAKRPVLKKLAPAPSSKARQQKVALPKIVRAPRTPKPKRTPQTQMLDSFDVQPASASPKPARPATNRDDTDYNALPDFSPPLETLKGNSKALKAEWKGTVLDLSNDPDRHMLHEAELHLAATLRLNCATYLCSKRRVFQARIEALRIGKEFRKTDAQQACKIDVNKASKLWQAYDKVGWFNPDYFRQQV